ncbi:General secretion pathway protein H [Beggiatoa sp. PS]|nr:General secretion pathway protein H [Beggiatoa sp. PS]
MALQNYNRSTGFSLLELLIVISIMAMGAAIVIPRLGGGESAILQAQVREVLALFRYARRSAIVEGKPKVVQLSQGKTEETTKKIIRSKLEPGYWKSRDVTLQWGENSSNQDKVSEFDDDDENQTEKSYKVTFYPEGGSSGGELILTYKEKFKAKINVNPITGKVTSDIFEFEQKEDD